MVFRRGGNRHDSWLWFCALHRELLAGTGVPGAITHREHRFRDLLRDGAATAGGAEAALSGLTARQWEALEQFAAAFFRERESYAPLELFPAFRREAQRRG